MLSSIRLEGIPFKWKGTDPLQGLDCFTFANFIRIKAKVNPFFQKLPLCIYPVGEKLPPGFLLEAAKQFTVPALDLQPLHIIVINVNHEDCISTLLPGGDVAFMTEGGSRLRSLKKFSGGSIRAILKPNPADPLA